MQGELWGLLVIKSAVFIKVFFFVLSPEMLHSIDPTRSRAGTEDVEEVEQGRSHDPHMIFILHLQSCFQKSYESCLCGSHEHHLVP